MRDTKKILESEIVHLKKTYTFDFDHFFGIKWMIFVLIVKNVIKIVKMNFLVKICDIRKKCSFQKGV